MDTPYHHGDLPRALLSHAADMAAEGNPESITLRGLARRAGVSHSAPVHHFGTRKQLLTSLAIEGFTALSHVLADHQDDIRAMGNVYVAWALDHPGYYAVMWQPRLLDDSSPELATQRERAWMMLSIAVSVASSADNETKREADALAAFAIVHGLASIWLSGALAPPRDPATLIAMVTERLDVSDRQPGEGE